MCRADDQVAAWPPPARRTFAQALRGDVFPAHRFRALPGC
jgi:hypothetical protein